MSIAFGCRNASARVVEHHLKVMKKLLVVGDLEFIAISDGYDWMTKDTFWDYLISGNSVKYVHMPKQTYSSHSDFPHSVLHVAGESGGTGSGGDGGFAQDGDAGCELR